MDQPLYSREEINKTYKKELQIQRDFRYADFYKSKGINENFKKMMSRENYDRNAHRFLEVFAPQLLQAIIVSEDLDQKVTSLLDFARTLAPPQPARAASAPLGAPPADLAIVAKQLIKLNSSIMNHISEFLRIQEEDSANQLFLLDHELKKLNMYEKVSFGKLYKGSKGGLYYKNKFGNKIYIKN